MIKHFHITNFKALRDVRLDLTPIHVLIGPNNAGKSSILQALSIYCRSVNADLQRVLQWPWNGCDLVWRNDAKLNVGFDAKVEYNDTSFDYGISLTFPNDGRDARYASEDFLSDDLGTFPNDNEKNRVRSKVFAAREHPTAGGDEFQRAAEVVHEALTGVIECRWSPTDLKKPATLNPEQRLRLTESGFGLATLLDDLNSEFNLNYDRLKEQFFEVFPDVRQIKLPRVQGFGLNKNERGDYITPTNDGKGIVFELTDGTIISAAQASDGMLVTLAYLALANLPEPPRLILIEEPENGLHPKRLSEVAAILRNLAEGENIQVVMTTHSPYMLDHFDRSEVTVCIRDAEGAVQTRRLSDVPSIERDLDVFSLGEVWSAVDEVAVVNGQTRLEDEAT